MAQILCAAAQFEQDIKGSRFLAMAQAVQSAEQALDWLRSVHVADATHNCWAYRIGGLYRFNDDGEPGGSAGRPILAAIDGQDVDFCVCVVVRWYGGTKLGVGGLVRAYGGTAAECLRTAELAPIVLRKVLSFAVPFESLGPVHQALEAHHAVKLAESWTADGLQVQAEVAEYAVDALRQNLIDATRGQIHWEHHD